MSARAIRASAVLLFLLLLSGSYDSERLLGEPLLGVPDALVLALACLVLLGGWALLSRAGASRRGMAPVAASMSLMLAVWAGSGLWGLRTEDHTDHVARLVAMMLVVVATWLLCSVNSGAFWDAVAWAAFGAGVAYAVLGLATAVGTERLAVLGGGPNVYGRVTAGGTLALLYLLIANRLSIRWGAIVPVLLAATVLSGSRGAMVGLAVGLAVLVMVLPLRRFTQIALGGLAGAALALVLLPDLGSAVLESLGSRLLLLTVEERYLAGRDRLWGSALDQLSENGVIAGQGLQTYTVLVGTYPHNLVLDMLLAAGAIVVALLLVSLTLWLRLVAARARVAPVAAATAIALLYLSASMVSGDPYDSRFVWFFMVISGCLAIDTSVPGDGKNGDAELTIPQKHARAP